MADEEEVLEPRRSRLPRWLRMAALVAVILAVAVLIVVRTWSHGPSNPQQVAATSTAPQLAPTPPAWPTAPEACGGEAELPIVSSEPAREQTGIAAVVGGGQLNVVNFDSERRTIMSGAHLRAGEFVTALLGSSLTYALTTRCATSGPAVLSHLLKIANGSARSVTLQASFGTIMMNGVHPVGVTYPDDEHESGYLVPFDGGSRVRLPGRFWPEALTDGVLIGNRETTSAEPGPLILVDASTGHIRANLGPGLTVAAGQGTVVWAVGCDLHTVSPCTIHSRTIAGGSHRYSLPSPPGFATGVISSDGRQLAFTLERRNQDPRYNQEHPIPPTDIAVLHLDTGELDVVAGIEMPAKDAPGLAFSPNGRWLVVALDAGTKTRLLAWRHGLARPYEFRPIPGLAWGPPAIMALPGSGG